MDLPVEEDGEAGLTDRSLLTMADIFDFARTVDIGDVRPILSRQMDCNMAIAQEGLTHSYGASIGQVIQASAPADDLIAKAKAFRLSSTPAAATRALPPPSR